MKRALLLACVLGLVATAAITANATVPVGTIVNLYADTAPNGYGSPYFAGWKTAAFAAAADGTFVNMASGANPGTTNFVAREAIVYSGGDLGKRLHWVYWLPGETVAGLAGRFQVKDVADWDGVAYAGGSVEDGPEVGWATPTSWVNYDTNGDSVADGVMGTFGNGWWPAYSETAIQSMVSDMHAYQTYWQGVVRYRNSVEDSWQTQSLTLNLVPEPANILALVSGVLGMGLIRRRK